MKHRIISLFFSLFIYCNCLLFSLNGLDFNWLKLMYQANKSVLNFTIDAVEDSLAKVLGGQSKHYKAFKAQSDALQEEIIHELDKITVANKEDELEKANALFKKLREQEDALLADAQQQLSVKEYEQLAHMIKSRQVVAAHKITALSTLKVLSNLAEGLRIKLGLPANPAQVNTKELIQAANPLGVSLISKDKELSFYEKLYLKNREPIVKAALRKALNYQGAVYPILGFIGTGGGYRAMILSTGYCKALSKMDLLEGMTYMSSLSGSTWFLAPWIISGLSIEAFQEVLRTKIRQGKFDLKSMRYQLPSQIHSLVEDILWPKFIYSQPISSIDLFGALLSYALLWPFEQFMHKQTLSAQVKKVIDGKVPFPIYTAVSMHNVQGVYRYHWYEFNPLFIRNLEMHLSMPSTTFGSSYYQGYIRLAAPEQALGFLLGTFGSAYTVNVKDIDRILQASVAYEEQQMQGAAKTKYTIIKQLLSVIQDLSPISTARFSPAQVANPFYGYTPEVKWLNDRILLTFVDGGISYNIPVRPLALPERKAQVLIIGESSGNAPTQAELHKAFEDLKRVYGYEYTQVNTQGSSVVQFYKDLKHPHAPKIIYVTYLKDQALIEKEKEGNLKELIDKANLITFDPIKCVEKEACNTFNFNYTLKDFDQLAGLAEFNLYANRERVIQFLKDTIQ